VTTLQRKVWRDGYTLRGPALAITLVLAAGVATWIMTFGMINALRLSQTAFYHDYRFADLFATARRAPLSITAQLAALPGVAQVSARVVTAARLALPNFDQPINALLVSLPSQGEPPLNRLWLASGRLPAAGTRQEVVVSEPFAQAHQLALNSELVATIQGHQQRLRVVGVGLSPAFIYQIEPGAIVPDYARYGVVWLRRDTLAPAAGLRGAANDFLLQLRATADRPALIAQIDRILAPYGGQSAYDRSQQLSHHYLEQELAGLEGSARVVPLIFIAVAAFLVGVVVARLVRQQRPLIALLKSFGYRDRTIAIHYLQLVLLLLVGGIALGLLIGLLLGQELAQLYANLFRFPLLHYRLEPSVVASALLVTLLTALLAASGALLAALRLQPAAAMQPASAAHYRPLPHRYRYTAPAAATRMLLRHLQQRPWQALLVVIGIALAGALLLVGRFQGDAIEWLLQRQFRQVQREDILITFTEAVTPAAQLEVARLPGVLQLEPLQQLAVRLTVGHRQQRTLLQGMVAQPQLRRLLDQQGRAQSLPLTGLLLSRYLGEQLHAPPGSGVTVTLLTHTGTPQRQLSVAGWINDSLGVAAYLPLSQLDQLLPEGARRSTMLLRSDPQQLPALLSALQQRPRIATIQQKEAMLNAFRETIGHSLLVMALINTLLAATITVAVIYNSGRIALAEQQRELATLRVLGFRLPEVARIILGEQLLLLLLAIPLATLFGYLIGQLLVTALASELYRIPLVLHPVSYLFTVLLLLSAAAVSGWLLWRQLRRLDLLAVLKRRE